MSSPHPLSKSSRVEKQPDAPYAPPLACTSQPPSTMPNAHPHFSSLFFISTLCMEHRYTPWVLINGQLSPSGGDKLLDEVGIRVR